jgi:hypothetical protein
VSGAFELKRKASSGAVVDFYEVVGGKFLLIRSAEAVDVVECFDFY